MTANKTESITFDREELITLLTFCDSAATRYGSLYPSEQRVRNKILAALEKLEYSRYKGVEQ